MTTTTDSGLDLAVVRTAAELPDWLDLETLTSFLHESLKPYQDAPHDIRKGIDYALDDESPRGGFVVLASEGHELKGALVMLHTGMSGYIPENLLLFVAVDPSTRGQGVGRRVIERALVETDGPVKLHVEYDNPAKRLYERIGFTSKYAEMRYNG